jgi:hypothetical protein
MSVRESQAEANFTDARAGRLSVVRALERNLDARGGKLDGAFMTDASHSSLSVTFFHPGVET